MATREYKANGVLWEFLNLAFINKLSKQDLQDFASCVRSHFDGDWLLDTDGGTGYSYDIGYLYQICPVCEKPKQVNSYNAGCFCKKCFDKEKEYYDKTDGQILHKAKDWREVLEQHTGKNGKNFYIQLIKERKEHIEKHKQRIIKEEQWIKNLEERIA